MQPHTELDPLFWQNNKLIPEIRSRLLLIANSFNNALEPKLSISNILFTGSSCSYNYHSGSDLDIHLIYDFSKINQDELLVRNFLLSEVAMWNNLHEITIHEKEVELYTESIYDKNISNGIYSILNDKWIQEPKKEENININEDKVKELTLKIQNKIDQLEHLFQKENIPAAEINTKANNIKKNLRIIRKKSLDKNGIYGIGNLIFKNLRDTGYLEKLKTLGLESYDVMFTESKIKTLPQTDTEYWGDDKNLPRNLKTRLANGRKPSKEEEEELNKTKKYLGKNKYGNKVYDIDGEYIREKLYPDFTEGGNDMAYPCFVPKNEIWLDHDVEGQTRITTLAHETLERYEMSQGKFYDVYSGKKEHGAHVDALEYEEKVRDGEEEPIKLTK